MQWYNMIMEYQKLINVLDEINHLNLEQDTGLKWMMNHKQHIIMMMIIINNNDYDKNKNIKFKMSMIRSSLCDCSNAYKLVKGTTKVPNSVGYGSAVNNTNKKWYLKTVLHLLVA